MNKITIIAVLFSGMLAGSASAQSSTIGDIDFFGYQGLDVAKVRAALPVHTDDQLTDQTMLQIVTAVVGAIGKPPTGIDQVCCDPQGRMLIYIGLPGGTYKPFTFNPAPTGTDKLPPEIVTLAQQAKEANAAAVEKGGQNATGDDSQGYALTNYPPAKALQLQERAWAVEHGAELEKVLRSSSDATQRQWASQLLGYAQQSPEQIAALVYAARDPDSTVRNNATRALAVLVRANPKLAADIEPDTFLAMLGSGSWTDHNKAVALLDAMTVGRDPKLLAKIREQALEPLIEMATWTEYGHAGSARIVLGRVAGIPEEKLQVMSKEATADAIVAAVRGK